MQNQSNTIKTFFILCISLFSSALFSMPGGMGGNPGGGNKITANPDDYFLSETVDLDGESYSLPIGTEWYVVPDIERLRDELDDGTYSGDVVLGAQILFGYDIMVNTYNTIGDARTDGNPPLYQGRVMNCSTCHAQGGTVPHSYPLFRSSSFYGIRNLVSDPTNTGGIGKQYGNLGYNRDIITRIRDCGVHCAGGGEIPEDSDEMAALIAWTLAVREGIYPGEGIIDEFKNPDDLDKIPGARTPPFTVVLDDPSFQADPVAGERFYKRNCSSCHGKTGEGKWHNNTGYQFPPLAGEASFTKAGGPYMVPVLAAFIKRQMPLSNPGSLTEQEAIDVAAHISTFDRDSRWWQDYFFEHNPCGRPAFLPLDVGTVPSGYPFSADQTQFGPWGAINTWLKSTACNDYTDDIDPDNFDPSDPNKLLTPLLDKDFDTGFDGIDFSIPGGTPALRR